MGISDVIVIVAAAAIVGFLGWFFFGPPRNWEKLVDDPRTGM